MRYACSRPFTCLNSEDLAVSLLFSLVCSPTLLLLWSICQDYPSYLFNIVSLFCCPQVASFPLFKTCLNRKTSSFPLIPQQTTNYYMVLFQNNLLFNCNLISCIFMFSTCIFVNMHWKPLIWCFVPHGCQIKACDWQLELRSVNSASIYDTPFWPNSVKYSF